MATLAVACGSAGGPGGTGGTSGTGGTGGTSGSGNGGGQACTPTQHRAKASVCSPTVATPGTADSGPPPKCSTSSDCKAAGYGLSYCQSGTCSTDQCFSDADCAGEAICECSTDFYGGNGYHGNICVPATCHVDGDCTGGGLCAPTIGSCGTPESYHCAPTGAAKCGGNEACSYAPQKAAFACAAASVCAG